MRRGIATFRFLIVAASSLLAGVLLLGILHVMNRHRPRRFVTVAVMHGEPMLPVKLRGLTLAPQDLPGVVLTNCRLVGDWRGKDLRGAELCECDLTATVLDYRSAYVLCARAALRQGFACCTARR
jgi:hypothetical protein